MTFSRTQKLSLALCAGALFLAQPAKAMPVIDFDFNPTAVAFDAGTIDFDMDTLFDDFTIVTQTGGLGDLISLDGEIDGTFAFTATGEVTSTLGTMSIEDDLGAVLTGDLNFETITFDEGPLQFITIAGLVDFSTPYTGTNSDLISLATFGSPFQISADFAYLGLTTLANLVAFGDGAGTQLVPALGTVTLPEPRSLALLGMGILGIGFFGARRRRHQSQSVRSTPNLEGRQTADAIS